MVDILLICITVIMVIIIFGVSFYMLIVYCHRKQSTIQLRKKGLEARYLPR